jgi:hypothetical protein
MKKRAKTGTSRKKIAVILTVLVAFSLVIYLGVVQNLPRPPKTAKEYFEVISAAVEPTGKERIDENGTVWVIYGVAFTFKPILGEAHGVLVKSWANSPPQDIGDLSVNQIRTVVLLSNTGSAIRQDADGKFRVTVNVESLEARGPLTLELSP